MKIKIYKTSDSNNTINKTLNNMIEYDINFKDNTNILSPSIKIRSGISLVGYNYCYIPEFNRFYFITNIEIINGDIFDINLKCDVLESNKKELMLCSGLVTRNTNGTSYISNLSYDTDVRKEVDIFKSDGSLIDDFKYVAIILKTE